jgi:putative peptide zinc metalloprotease protein
VFRAILFTGIALAVYHYFFKALGIILFLVEIGYFLIGPIWSEIREWAKMRNEIVKGKRFWATTAVVCIAVVALLIPWSTTVWVPAVLEANETARLHISVPARIVSINTSAGAQVSIGAPLVKLASADLDHQLKIAKLKKNIVDMRLARLAGTPADREAALVLQQEQEALERAAAGIRQRISELDVIAPIAGTVASLVENAAPGRWVSPSEPLAILDGKVGARIRGLVDAGDISRVRQGMRARFIPNDPLLASHSAQVTMVALTNVKQIDQLELANIFGGSVPATRGANGEPIPVTSQYPLLASLEVEEQASGEHFGINQSVAGVLLVQGDAESILHRFVNRIAQVLIRESGF